MIDLIPAFIYAKDAQSRFTACNKLVANRMGVEPEELIGKTDFDFFPREMAEKFFADEQALIQSGEPLIDREEIAFDKTRGMDRVILTSKVPLRDADGNLTGIVGTGYDITDRKAAEERMASSERHESIGRLAAGVAHEINTPIQYLNGQRVVHPRRRAGTARVHRRAARGAMPGAAGPMTNVEDLRKELPPALEARGGRPVAHRRDRALDEGLLARRPERDGPGGSQSLRSSSTLVVARSEYKHGRRRRNRASANSRRVTCHGGQINQVVLNLIVNAAHAIADVVRSTGDRGKITVRTRDRWRRRGHRDRGHRRRHSRSDPRAHLRSVLHDQGSRHAARARACPSRAT